MDMHPGICIGREDGDWPTDEEIAGQPAGITLGWVHFPFSKPRRDFHGSRIVLQLHKGDWTQGARIYRTWSEATLPPGVGDTGWMRKNTDMLSRYHADQEVLPGGDSRKSSLWSNRRSEKTIDQLAS